MVASATARSAAAAAVAVKEKEYMMSMLFSKEIEMGKEIGDSQGKMLKGNLHKGD
jgi:hypothetical protein